MPLFERCLSIQNAFSMAAAADCEDSTAITLTQDTTFPSFFATRSLDSNVIEARTEWKGSKIYYISDLHLDTHIVYNFPKGANDQTITAYIHDIVLQLFSGSFIEEIRRFRSPIVLFGGDISSYFDLSRLFYSDFISTWNSILNESYQNALVITGQIQSELNSIASKITELEESRKKSSASKESRDYPSNNPTSSAAFQELKKRQTELEERMDELLQEHGLSCYWETHYQESCKTKYVYAVLGNHELWDFPSYSSCKEAYRSFFSSFSIIFLENTIKYLGKYQTVTGERINPETEEKERVALSPISDCDEYSKQSLFEENAIIVGGLGFSARNMEFNADQGIYGVSINRRQELEESKNWIDTFSKAIHFAKMAHCTLLVLTHTPVSDWIEETDLPDNCVFISGHTHRNIAFGGERNNYFYQDNQVGYSKNSFHFKQVLIYKPRNPFASEPDGYRMISLSEYIEFYRFNDDGLPGTGNITRLINKYGGGLYIIKNANYYGFFLKTSAGIYVCNGGIPKRIKYCPNDMGYVYQNFSKMVNAFIQVFSPLRRVQEKLSAIVKSIGGDGVIHGTIVDIDFCNHIMVNTFDGKLTFYYSPKMGIIKTYPSFQSLLHAQLPELERLFLANAGSQKITYNSLAKLESSPYMRVNIKNSQYSISRKVNALQRLFEINTLRDWNSDLIRELSSPSDYLLEEK